MVDGATRLSVVDSTGRARTAEVVGVDSTTDLAVVRTGAGLPAVTLGTSADLAVGDPVLAVGSPLGRAGGNIGIGFAIPVDRAASVAETLIAGG